MEMYEVGAALKYSHYAVQDNWEQARLIAYAILQSNSSKKIDITKIMQFPWDENNEETDTRISKEDIERLNKKADAYLKYIQKK